MSEKLNELKDLVEVAENVLTNQSMDLDELGNLLHQTCLLKRRTGDKISTYSINILYEKGIKAGALGGKLLGTGGGGFILFYVTLDRHKAVKKAMSELMYVPFEFEEVGTCVIHYAPEEKKVVELCSYKIYIIGVSVMGLFLLYRKVRPIKQIALRAGSHCSGAKRVAAQTASGKVFHFVKFFVLLFTRGDIL